ncbi:MAG: dihydrofolate synthase/folylpolyglutamate synthase, partial [Sphingobacteriales bacterium]
MNYQETISHLFSQLPMFQRVGASAFKKSLDNILLLSKACGDPHRNFKSIHIAGTNGKGSTAHLLASTLQYADLKVGLYTSPHLTDFRERIKVNGQCCEEQFVIDFVKKYEEIIEEIKPSFFETTVAMAFLYFSDLKVDIAVIETGMGGRLDSTNIITPLVSVITNISNDHG